jgi:hypothetical protein
MRRKAAFSSLFVALSCALALATACGADRCLVYEYGPPSLRLALRDGATGEPICSTLLFSVSTNRGAPIAHEDVCEWWLPAWTPGGDAGAVAAESEVEITVAGYPPQTLVVDIPRNACGEVEQPAPLLVTVQPAS